MCDKLLKVMPAASIYGGPCLLIALALATVLANFFVLSIFGPFDYKSQERAHESLKGLTFYFDFFIIIFFVFSTQIHNFERSFSLSSDPNAVLFRLAKFLLETSKSNVNGALQRFTCPFLALRVSYRCTGSTPLP
jgi:hypothetical protein